VIVQYRFGVSAPGAFWYLLRENLVDAASVERLVARVPATDEYVRTDVRGGEGFDSKRWPIARDAALARWAALRCPDPDGCIADALARLEVLRDVASLRALARSMAARQLAGTGMTHELFKKLWRDATGDDLGSLDGASPPAGIEIAADVIWAHYQVADGLYAYHVHRGLPGPAAEAAARVIGAALRARLVGVDELVDAALALVRS
jgi:hypothetical protein